MATFSAELVRDGPGLLLRDILAGQDPKIGAAAEAIVLAAPDILVLTGFDYDHDGHALAAFAETLAALGADYPHRFAQPPNTGLQTGRDLDGDGRIGGPRDALGYGEFAGQAGMAILSRHPIDADGARDFTGYLWSDLPGSLGLDETDADIRRLSTTGHWEVPVDMPDGSRMLVLAFHATPPVFDGPEDRNGRRNHDETAFWTALIDGRLGLPPPAAPFVIAGDANLDPLDGDGRSAAMAALLAHPRIIDPQPSSAEGAARALRDGGANRMHRGDPSLDTADWPDEAGGPGNLRVDYVLPSREWTVTGAGTLWPSAESGLRHALVWVDLAPQRGAERRFERGLR